MNCSEIRAQLSSYLDGAMTGKQMRVVHSHVAGCTACGSYYLQLKRTQGSVAALGRKPAPPELALRLRVAISREIARTGISWRERLRVRLENAINAFAVPATAGALSAVVVFGLLIGYFALPPALQADNNDVPTSLYTPPELKYSPFEMAAGTFSDAVVVEAYVDANGRVQDYKVLSAPPDMKDSLPELSNVLIFSQFRPATAFGQPTSGKIVLSFSRVNVKG
jgi:putative zinc finger protein